jgi:predicted DNA-binding protein
MLTLRLDKETEKELERRSQATGVSKSEIVRKSLKQYLRVEEAPTPYELGKDVFGKFDSGDGTLSQNKRSKVSEKIRSKKG